MPHTTALQVEQTLRVALSPTALTVQDDSRQHAGHVGAREGSHFSVSVVSAAFEGLSRVARHRLVYSALSSEMRQGIHALAIEARTPAEAA